MPSFAELKKSRATRQNVRADVSSSSGTQAEIQDRINVAHDPETARRPEAIAAPSNTSLNRDPVSSRIAEDLSEPCPDAELYSLPSSLVVRRTPRNGRGVYAASALKAGQVILRLKPTVAVLSSAELSSRCSACALSLPELAISGQDVKALKRCTLCKVVHYCSVRQDWKAHKPECEAHRALRGVFVRSSPDSNPDEDRRWVMSESIRALGRICWLRKVGGTNGADSQEWKALEAMESHTKRLSENELLLVGKQVQHLRHYLSIGATSGQTEPVPADMAQFGFSSSAELLSLVSAFTVNSHTLSSPSLSPIGVATSPTAALFNHSCVPNCAVVFPRGGENLEVVALRAIESDEELLMSYVDISLPRHERQADLKKRYGFDCDCALCQSEDVEPRWCVRHVGCPNPTAKGKGKMPDLNGPTTLTSTCDACRGDFTVDARHLRELIERGRTLLQDDEKGTLALSNLIPSLVLVLPPSSYPLFALLRLRALLLTPPETPAALQECIASYAMAYAGAEHTHPPGHPTLAIILAEWGKTLSMELPDGTGAVSKQDVMKRLMEAVVVLRKAYTACERGFGPGGGIVGKEVEGLIRGCEGEIGLMRYAQ